jgi:hypothetical protein
VPAVEDVDALDAQPLAREALDERRREDAISAAREDPGGRVGPAVRPERLERRRLGLVALRASAVPTRPAGTSWKKVVTRSYGASGSRPSATARSRAASRWPLADQKSSALSPGAGTIGQTSASSATGIRPTSRGAV